MERRNYIMFVKSFWLAGLLVVGACAVNAQQYWSANASLNCGNYGTDVNGTPLQITNGGYVCYIYGTLPWYASGAGWGSSIRVSAPPSAPVAYFFNFSDVNGNDATLDFLYEGDATVSNGTSASQALYANQPLEVDILGLHSQAPNYGTTANGPAVVLAECPDANTCAQVQAQLIYSALPSEPWSLSAPVIFDWQTSYAWSSVGVDDGSTNTVSFVIYNLDTVGLASHTYTLNVYDATGKLFSTAVTPSVPLYGSYANVLRKVVASLPTGSFKLQVVGTTYTAFEALQFHGPSATTLVSAAEVVPAASPATGSSVAGRNRHPLPSALQMARPRGISQ
jgi:hypothetical protein